MDLEVSVVDETNVPLALHARIAELLRDTIDSRRFAGCMSWAGARPEHRVIAAREDGGLVGHLGILTKTLLVDGTPRAAGQIGLLAATPGHQSQAIEDRIMDSAMDRLTAMDVAFGFANVTEDRVPRFTERGWTHLPATDTRVLFAAWPFRALTLTYPIVVLPVRSPVEPLREARLIDVNGFEL